MLEINEVSKHYQKGKTLVKAVQKVSFKINKHQIMGLVGESGCGKSTLAKMILMLEKPTEGEILFNSQNLFKLDRRQKQEIRRQIQIVFQNPYSALNPRMTLQQILSEPLDILHLFTGASRINRIEELIHMIGLEKCHLQRYPHQFSGGQRQRICIARALAVEPSFLVCDEPLSALDLTTQVQIIELLKKCQKELGLTMLFISHDLAAVDALCDQVVSL
jgi:ABC-type glutathione transport system ATPase component